MNVVVKALAKEIAPQLETALADLLAKVPESDEAVTNVLWENKSGILRVLQAVATE